MKQPIKFIACVVLFTFATTLTVAAAPGSGQQSQEPSNPQPSQNAAKSPAAAPRPTTNIQLDLVVTDTKDGQPTTKSASLLIASGNRSSTRATGRTALGDTPIIMGPEGPVGGRPFSLNIDASASLVRDHIIQVRATFEFNTGTEAEASLLQSIDVYLQNGRTLLVSKSADPVANRTVTVELTATIREP